ncbi:hypothetical protein MAC_02172 [Metarhizium acridum CQMa 102]|uniref:Uncharacterized protein n=1 Tax=Metarhizium acridum (strain CQMa 102) TaxID=655827 RepID=E9DX24_METAQ|nr:uncharacterized protein MAC_02172 [Metarhizium acridum CQMa 102]EFY91887.1 hypothetical protein MAC_02172 [Metarhizium acridum CQMa 102]
MKGFNLFASALAIWGRNGSPIPEASAELEKGNSVETYALRSGWGYIKRRDEGHAQGEPLNQVDTYALRSGWGYIKKRDGGHAQGEPQIDVDTYALRGLHQESRVNIVSAHEDDGRRFSSKHGNRHACASNKTIQKVAAQTSLFHVISCINLFMDFCLIYNMILILITGTYMSLSLGVSLSQTLEYGNSPDEARDKGCRFGIMSFSWLSPLCFDQELTREFEAFQSWKWYNDPAGLHQVHKDEVIKGEHPSLFVSNEYHHTHCVFMRKKLHRAVALGQRIDGYIGNHNDTAHCGVMLMQHANNPGSLDTKIWRKFPTCSRHNIKI